MHPAKLTRPGNQIMRLLISGFLFLMLLLTSCRPVNEMTIRDLSWLYKADNQHDVSCVLVNLNDSVSRAFLTLGQPAGKESHTGPDTITPGFRIKYILYKSWNTAEIADSGTVFSDYFSHGAVAMPFKTEFSFRAAAGQNYLLFLSVFDIRHQQETKMIRELIKNDNRSAGWYLVKDHEGEPVEADYLTEAAPVSISYFGSPPGKFYITRFNHIFPPALPPFATELRERFDYRYDSLYTAAVSKGATLNLALPGRGMHFIHTDSAGTRGKTLYRFYHGYPAINSPSQMIETVRYITSTKEYEQLLRSADTKTAIDSFWVATGGNIARGVELIRQYYGRVERANRFFTSFCEGWKTDRGMIYVVFGPPNIVYRNGKQEEWIYGEARNYRSVHFIFVKVENPFTGNDYVLQRQPNFKEFWYMAVQQWRR